MPVSAQPNERFFDPRAGRTGAQLRARMQVLGVEVIPTEYRHRPADDDAYYLSSRYVLDAILSLRRTARQLRRGRTRRLRKGLADPRLPRRRFNVAGAELGRRVHDDGWIARRRISQTARTRLYALFGRA